MNNFDLLQLTDSEIFWSLLEQRIDNFFCLNYFAFEWCSCNFAAFALFGAFSCLFYCWFSWLQIIKKYFLNFYSIGVDFINDFETVPRYTIQIDLIGYFFKKEFEKKIAKNAIFTHHYYNL
jgi:hypothetical protein